MKIALLMPSRERLNLKLTIISSIMTTVKDINNVTLYMGVDEDDPTKEISQKIANAIPFVKYVNLPVVVGETPNIHKMWNICARESSEEILGMIGDDMIFKTPNWDEAVLNEFVGLEGSDKFKLVYCNDGFRPGDMCVNSFIHREYMDINGYYVREDFVRNWADQWLWQIFGAFDRLTYLENITIQHNHWVFGAMKKDSIAQALEAREGCGKELSDVMWHNTGNERDVEVNRIAKHYNLTPNWDKVENKDRITDE